MVVTLLHYATYYAAKCREEPFLVIRHFALKVWLAFCLLTPTGRSSFLLSRVAEKPGCRKGCGIVFAYPVHHLLTNEALEIKRFA